VRSGDNFWTIARQHYGAGRYANALAAYNQARIPDPRKMRPGMKVLIPDAQVLVQLYPRLTGAAYGPQSPAAAQPAGFFVDSNGQPAYRVGRHDTLSDIAARCLGRSSRWVQVLGMNRDQLQDAGSLKSGMVLRLPADATQVSVVSGEALAR
jgi:nucleoid-associated protein YgaU